MNLEEAKANIGKEVIHIKTNENYIIDSIGSKSLVFVKKKSREQTYYVDPHLLKLKEQPMQNYKIKVTPETSAEVQELFFELGYFLIKDHYYHADMDYLLIGKNFISYTNSFISFNECEYQEITLPQLRDLVVLKRNNVIDATHGAHFSYERFYISENCTKEYADGKWIDKVSHAMPVLLSELEEHFKEMTWQDALLAVIKGEDVEFDSGFGKKDLSEYMDVHFEECLFNIKPQTVHIDGGDYTKEELLKIAGEME